MLTPIVRSFKNVLVKFTEQLKMKKEDNNTLKHICGEIAIELQKKMLNDNQTSIVNLKAKSFFHSATEFTSIIAQANEADALLTKKEFDHTLAANDTSANITTLFDGLENELKLMRATPKNKEWFDKSYVTEQESQTKCETCKHDCPRNNVRTVNHSPTCLSKIVELFKRKANETYEDSRTSEALFILKGYVGEGKSAWSNWLDSSGQDIFWKEKLINIKIPASNGMLLDDYHNYINSYFSSNRARQAIWNMASTKFMRIFFKHYYTQRTVYITSALNEKTVKEVEVKIAKNIEELKQEINSNLPVATADKTIALELEIYNKISFEVTQSGDHTHLIYTTIVYNGGPMGDKEMEQYLALSEEISWKDAISEIFDKSQHTLNNIQISEINVIADETIKRMPEAARDWNPQLNPIDGNPYAYPRDKYIGVCQDLADAIAAKLLDFGYRFLVKFDGFDTHYPNFIESEKFLSFASATLKAVANLGSSGLKPAVLVIVRNETLDRLRMLDLLPNQIDNSANLLRLEPIDIGEILQRRINNIIVNSKYSEAYRKGVVDLVQKYLKGVFEEYLKASDYRAIAKEIGFNPVEVKEKSFLLLAYMLRKNTRHALETIVLLFKEIHIKILDEKAFGSAKNRNAEDAINDLKIASNLIAKKQYFFWHALLAKRYHVYTEHYKYSARSGSVKFDVDEFKNGFTIDRLFLALSNDGFYLGTQSDVFSVTNLNDILKQVDFYVKITALKYSEPVSERIEFLKKHYDETMSERDLEILNRNLLEELYPLETPKSRVSDSVNINSQNNKEKPYWIDRETRDNTDSDRAFGTVPNIFSFISCKKNKDKTNPYLRNKLGIRIRIMKLLQNNPQKCKDLARKLHVLFEIPEDEILWEIDELILMGLIVSVDNPGQYCGQVVLNKNLEIKPSQFWTMYERFMFKPPVLDYLLPAIHIPKKRFLFYKPYTNFSYEASKELTDNHDVVESKSNALTSKFIVFITMLVYLLEHEVETLSKLEMMLSKDKDKVKSRMLADLTLESNTHVDDLKIFSHCRKIINDEIVSYSAIGKISENEPEVVKRVINNLHAYLASLRTYPL